MDEFAANIQSRIHSVTRMIETVQAVADMLPVLRVLRSYPLQRQIFDTWKEPAGPLKRLYLPQQFPKYHYLCTVFSFVDSRMWAARNPPIHGQSNKGFCV